MTTSQTAAGLPENRPERTADAMLHRLEQAVGASPLTSWLGMRPTRCWDGHCELVLPVRTDLTQHHGQLHGGLLGIAIDNACAWAAASLVDDVVTSDYTVHLLAPARGTHIHAVADVLRAGRRTIVARADVFAHQGDDGTLVATGMAAIRVVLN